MAYVITLLAMAIIAVFSAFFIFKDKHPKREK